MTFFQFTLKNLFRRRVRTLLTIMGIGLGIGAVVALLGLAWGLQSSWQEGLKARKTDLVIRRAGGGLVAQPFDLAAAESVRQAPGIAGFGGVLAEVTSVETVPLMVISGREWGTYLWETMSLVSGRLPKGGDEKAVVLGTIAAEMLQKKVGDTITLEVEEFPVVGIVDGKAVVENGTVIVSLEVLQNLMQKEGKVNFVNIRVTPEAGDLPALAAKLNTGLPGLKVEIAEDVFAKNDAMRGLEAMNWGTSAVAIIVGVFGVMNTMFMSVFERNRELAILMALGWKRKRILRMIIAESVTLCAVAGVIGVVSGIVILKTITSFPWMRGRLDPYIGWDLCALAMLLAMFVGLVSGLYPALRCTKINPSLAIRGG